MRLLYLFFSFASFLFFNSTTIAQITITGQIVDAQSQSSLSQVTIATTKQQQGTVSGEQGRFSLKIASPDSLTISYVGYASQTFFVSNDRILQVDLAKTDELIDPFTVRVEQVPAIIVAHTLLLPYYPFQNNTLQWQGNKIAITSALNNVSGVYMHTGALNTNRITIRGIGNRSLFSTTKIRAYLDDISLTTGDGETTIEDIDLSIIEQVMVHKGPTASIYGAGLGGMIHLQTALPNDPNPNEFAPLRKKLQLDNSFGSYGLRRTALTFFHQNKVNTARFAFNIHDMHSDGYRENNQYNRQGGNILGKIKLNWRNEATIFGSLTNLRAFIPSSLSRADYDNNPEKAAFTWRKVMGFEDYSKKIIGVSNRMKVAYFDRTLLVNKTSLFANQRDSYESRPFNILEEDSRSVGFRSSFDLYERKTGDKTEKYANDLAATQSEGRYSVMVVPSISDMLLKTDIPFFTTGIEYFRERYSWSTFVTNEGRQGDVLTQNREIRHYYNLFAQSTLDLHPRLKLMGGLNLNQTFYDYQDQLGTNPIDRSGNYSFDAVLSPMLELRYFQHPLFEPFNTRYFLRISHGFSPPSLEETLTPEGAINPDIQPEKGWNFELGLSTTQSSSISGEIRMYQMTIRDLLVTQRTDFDQYVGLNAGKTRHTGLELAAQFNIGNLLKSPLLSDMNASLSYTYANYKFIDFVNEEEDYSGNELTGTPPHHLNIGLDYRKKNFYANINYKFLDAFPMRDDNSIYSEAYQVVNTKAGYKTSFQEKINMDIYVGVNNLFNEKYASMILINAASFGGNPPRYYYPGLPRNWYVGLNLEI